MEEEFGDLALGFRPIFSCLITTMGTGLGSPEAPSYTAASLAGTDCSVFAGQVRLSLLGVQLLPPGAWVGPGRSSAAGF